MVFKIDLRSHPFLHGAYFFDEDFNLYEHGTEYDSETAAKAALTKAEGTISHPNYMYTSEVDNPFFFPSQGVNAIGSGEIVAVKNAAKAMSEGTAYGSMPLYAFCTDGVWPLSVGTTGLFVATNPPTRETLLGNDPDAALQIDNSIIFLSERGLMQLIGERTTLLSGDLQERFSTFDVDDLPGWTRIVGKFRGNGTNALFLIGDSAATLLILYLTAVLHSPVVASQLGMKEACGTARILAIAGCSGMYRFEGGVHGTAMGYYAEGYFPTLKERIRISPYLDVDRLVVDGNLPPFYLQTSTEDYLADNTLEFARILQYRHHDYELRLLPKGLDHALVHDFAVKEVGLEHNEESQQIVKEAATFFKRYRPTTS